MYYYLIIIYPNNCGTSSPFPQPPSFLQCPLVYLKCQLSL